MTLEVAARVAQRLTPCAVIGAYALAARGYVRQTSDFDLMTTDKAALVDATWDDLRREGYAVNVRKGDFDDPLGGVVRITGRGVAIDVVVAKYKWELGVLERAEPVDFGKATLKVPRPADLVLLKLSAGGYEDLHDIRRLLAVRTDGTTIVEEVNQAIADLPDAMKTAWQRFLDESRA